MNDQNQTVPNDTLHDELVAYLDGELDVNATQRIEERLATDANCRQRLQQLQRAWDMLDVLPRSSANETFTRTTVEMVALSAAADVEQLQQRVSQRQRWGKWLGLAAILLAGFLGYGLVGARANLQNKRLLQQLPVLANLDLYRQVDSLEFLRTIEREKLFTSSNRPRVTYIRFEPDQTLETRRQKLEQASATELEELRDRQERFGRFSETEKQRLLKLHEELSSDPQAEQLQNTLERYDDWLRSLPSGRSAELRALPEQERLIEMRRVLKEQDDNSFRRFADSPLSLEDRQVVLTWLEDWLAKNAKRIEEQLPSFMRDRMRDTDNGPRSLLFMYVGYLKMRHEKSGERPNDVIAPGAEDIRALEEKLSAEAKKQLLRARESNDERRLVQDWSRAALLSRLVPPVSDEELQRFYRDQLTPEDRQYLDTLPRDQFQRELRSKYAEYSFRRWGGRPMMKGGGNNGPNGFGEGARPFGDGPRPFGDPLRLPADGLRPPKTDRSPERRNPSSGNSPNQN